MTAGAGARAILVFSNIPAQVFAQIDPIGVAMIAGRILVVIIIKAYLW